ncbi:MAG: TetR/AcrR family transcriptional regulator [Gemmatimonadales bacterium]
MATAFPFYIRENDPPAKREILRAALRLFGKRGFEATSIRDIAEESGYTNPALYKHFPSKDALALHLFETCHTRVWEACAAAQESARGFDAKLDAYLACWLELMDEHPDVMAFLSDSARVLWPRARTRVRRNTMIGLAKSLAHAGGAANPDLAAAALQGTLAEVSRMIQVGALAGPAARWKNGLVTLFRRLVA